MSDVQLIETPSMFPAEPVDEAFGHYLSGLVDGEGSFVLTLQHDRGKMYPRAIFTMNLRIDDADILRQAQRHLGCGRVYCDKGTPKHCPMARLLVYRRRDHLRYIVPNFERFPLRAKKRLDFEIYKRGVELVHRIACTPQRSCRTGPFEKWLEADRQLYLQLRAELKKVRKLRLD